MSTDSPWRIPAGTAERYRSCKDAMAVAVSRRIAAHPRLEEFLGGNPLRLLDTNHRHHAAFMVEVFTANDRSIGVAALTPGEDIEQLLKRADDGLYRAKESGCNRVMAAA